MTGRTTTFAGARVALLESRLAEETAAMVRRLGGEPLSAPALAEVPIDADSQILAFADRLSTTADPIVIFLTGVAVNRLFSVTDRLGATDTLRTALARATLVARGPKPSGALARRGLTQIHGVREPFTTSDVIASLGTIDVTGRDVTILHYGERNDRIVGHLADRGARVTELMLYEWRLPDDPGPLSSAIDELVAGEIAVLVFTSQIQVRHLFDVAGPERRDALISVLNTRVLVGAVGPTCASACHEAGIHTVVMPERPKLGPLLQSLATAWSTRPHGAP